MVELSRRVYVVSAAATLPVEVAEAVADAIAKAGGGVELAVFAVPAVDRRGRSATVLVLAPDLYRAAVEAGYTPLEGYV